MHLKIIKKLLIPLVLLIGIAAPATVRAANWSIKNFKSDIVINQDSSIVVKEQITVDFSRERHHGIFRLIPVNYVDDQGKSSAMEISVINVTDTSGQEWNYTEVYEGNYLNIKIGDPDIYLNSIATFTIEYKVEGAIGYFEDHDELYWNVTGDKWEVPIDQAEASITLPQLLTPTKLQSACYTGPYGSKEQNCTTRIEDGKNISYRTGGATKKTTILPPGQGLTLVAGWPKGIVVFKEPPIPPTITDEYTDGPFENFPYQNPFVDLLNPIGMAIPLLSLFVLFYLWYTRGRDPKTERTTIMPYYTPPDNLTPAEVGVIMDEKADIQDITASMVDLAVKGYLQIIETKEKVLLWDTSDFEFKKLKEFEDDTTLMGHEKGILRTIFDKGKDTRKLSDLENSFYVSIPSIQKSMYKALVKKEYFPTSPEEIRKKYQGLGVGMLGIGIFGLQFFLFFGLVGLGIGLIFTGLLFTIFAPFMPIKTKKGVETKYQILGLKEYINTAEKDRLEFQEKENLFEKLLPYAMVFGITSKWTKTFEGIYKTPPSWYVSNDPSFYRHFNAHIFIHRLNSVSSRMGTAFTSKPAPRSSGSGFGGGGFSGGGGGGGGGGSW